MANLDVQIGGSIDGLKKALAEGDKDLKKFESSVVSSALKAESAMAAMGKGGQTMQSFAKSSETAGFALTNLGRVAQDAPYGFIGIQNNLNPLLESFQRLRAESGSNVGALKALGASLMGPAGIGIALSVASAAYLLYQRYASGAKKETEELAGAVGVLGKAYNSSDYKSAATAVGELTINVGLAKKGFIDKEAVVKEYNKTIGKTMGSVKNFDEVERKLTEGGPAYIRMMLLKAAANLALEEAAKSAFQAEQARLKKLSEFQGALDGTQNVNIRSAEDAKTRQKQIDRARQERKNQEIKAAEDRKKDLEQIATKFQTDAAEISKKFNFNFFEDTDGGKDGKKTIKKALPKKEDIEVAANEFAASVSVSVIEASARESLRAEVALKEQWAGIAEDLDQNAPQIDALIIKPIDMAELARAQQALIDFNLSASDIINNGLVNTFSGIGEAIGMALANGTSVIDSVGLSLLESLGGILTQLGQMAIATGIGIEAIKISLKSLNPVAAIAAGVALVALGGAVKAGAAKLSKSMGSSGSGGSSFSAPDLPRSGYTPSNNSSYAPAGSTSSGGGIIRLELDGLKAVALINRAGYQLSRYK